jgi:hypothetical protein
MPETDEDQHPDDGPATETLADAASRAAGERAREGLEHLQAAARELIAAARAALDVAEDIIDDPETIASMTGAAGSVGDVVGDLVRNLLAPRPARSGPSAEGGGSTAGSTTAGGTDTERAGPTGIQRITIA